MLRVSKRKKLLLLQKQPPLPRRAHQRKSLLLDRARNNNLHRGLCFHRPLLIPPCFVFSQTILVTGLMVCESTGRGGRLTNSFLSIAKAFLLVLHLFLSPMVPAPLRSSTSDYDIRTRNSQTQNLRNHQSPRCR